MVRNLSLEAGERGLHDAENEHLGTLLPPVSGKEDDGLNEFVALAERLESSMWVACVGYYEL